MAGGETRGKYVDLGSDSDNGSHDDEDLEKLRRAFMGVQHAAETTAEHLKRETKKRETLANPRALQQSCEKGGRAAEDSRDPRRSSFSFSGRSSAPASSKITYKHQDPHGLFLMPVSNNLGPSRASAPVTSSSGIIRGPKGRFLKHTSHDRPSIDRVPLREGARKSTPVSATGPSHGTSSFDRNGHHTNVIDSLIAPTAPLPKPTAAIAPPPTEVKAENGHARAVPGWEQGLFGVIDALNSGAKAGSGAKASSGAKIPKKKGRPRKHPLPASTSIPPGLNTRPPELHPPPKLHPRPSLQAEQPDDEEYDPFQDFVAENMGPSRRQRGDFDDEALYRGQIDIDRNGSTSRRARPRRGLPDSTSSHPVNSNPFPPPVHHPTRCKMQDLDELVRARELGGTAALTTRAIQRDLERTFKEDRIHRWRYLEGASKDVIVAAWSPNGRNYAVSTSTELDDASRPYNKEKNFLFGDLMNNTLRELDAHHIEKPRSETLGDRAESTANASTIVDERLFTTVSAICFSWDGKRMFSGSYDKTVKVWSASPKRLKPKCLQTLRHEGRVELLSVSENSRFLATGQSVTSRAISIYDVARDGSNQLEPGSSFIASQDSSKGQALVRFSYERVARSPLYPSAMQWGVAPSVEHLLVAGFAENNQDSRDRDREGDLCIWNVEKAQPLCRLMPNSQNVFDVSWHPSLPVFAAATTPGGQRSSRRGPGSVVKTFHPLEGNTRRLEFDCPALDINEVKFHPTDQNYVAAACTNGRIYIWDRRNPDQVLQTLGHGPCMEPLDEERTHEETDTGVRFIAWGNSGSQLFTGSSDGVIKCWNPFVHDHQKHVRDVATFDSAVMSGSFSPDGSHLLVGLCKGAVHMLSSAPWAANQDDTSDSEISGHKQPLEPSYFNMAPPIEYVSAAQSAAAAKPKRSREPSPVASCKKPKRRVFRDQSSATQKAPISIAMALENGADWDGATTEEDSDVMFERGVSEIELPDTDSDDASPSPSPSRDARTGKRGKRPLDLVISKGATPAMRPSPVDPGYGAPFRRSVSSQMEPPRTPSLPPISGSPPPASCAPSTPQEIRENMKVLRDSAEQRRSQQRDWREPPPIPKALRHLRNKRKELFEPVSKAPKNVIVISSDEDDD